ncbi:MAG: DHH family phosphoesterase [Bacteroides sp.]|nr:DHH family phosphoesterase [Bacteroides sp.]MCM1085274.1 DHH family phosphoesterase [Bacteroides sp.]MCM1169403.1 DHH family phosphoesterase [Bacteroides sp.]
MEQNIFLKEQAAMPYTVLPAQKDQAAPYRILAKSGQEIHPLKSYLEKARNIVIISHNNPDGDAVGSSMGLHTYLKNMGKDSHVMFPSRYAQNLAWMDSEKIALNYQEHPDRIAAILAQCDLLFVLDFNRLSRAEAMSPLLEKMQAPRIMIDHHLEPDTESFHLGFSNTRISSTCEVLYRVIYHELDPNFIDAQVGACLYAGISTDTGSFSYSCSHGELFSAIADLISKGLDTVKVHQNIFDNFSESRLRLLGCCLGERLVVKPEYETAYMYLNRADMLRYNFRPGDTEGIVNYGLSIAGIRFAAFFTQKEDRVRISFRSQGDIDVNKFAKEHFNGGGHKNAAGAASHDTIEETVAKFERLLPDFYEKSIRQK